MKFSKAFHHFISLLFFLLAFPCPSESSQHLCEGYLDFPFPLEPSLHLVTDSERQAFEEALQKAEESVEFYEKIDRIASFYLLESCEATKARLDFHEKKLSALKSDKESAELKVIGGYLVHLNVDPYVESHECQDLEKIITQVSQYAWNRLYFAGYGYATFEMSLHKLDRLQNALAKYLPSMLVPSETEKMFQISTLWKGYRTQDEVFTKRIFDLREKELVIEQIDQPTQEVPKPGLHEIWIIKERETGYPIAIAKDCVDVYFGKKIAECLGYAELANDPEIKNLIGQIAGWNELLSASMNQMMEGKLLTPLTAACGDYTLHAYRQNEGSFFKVYFTDNSVHHKRHLENYFNRIGNRRLQQTFLAHFLNHSLDAHLNNLLVEKDSLVLIDFGRSLGCHLDQTSFVVRNAALEMPLSDSTFHPMWKNILQKITADFYKQLQDLARSCVENDQLFFLVKNNIEHQKGNILALQAAIDLSASPKVLMATKFPKLAEDEWVELRLELYEQYGFSFSSERAEFREVRSVLDKRFAALSAPFHKAWMASFDPEGLNDEMFIDLYKPDIQRLMQTNINYYYTKEDKRWWKKAGKWISLHLH